MKKIKKRPVVLRFWDHCNFSGESIEAFRPLECEVVGYLVGETKLAYHVVVWVSEDDVLSENTDGYVVLKSTIISKRFL